MVGDGFIFLRATILGAATVCAISRRAAQGQFGA